MSEAPEEKTPAASEPPASAPAIPPAAKPAAKPAAPKIVYPEAKLNHAHGRLLTDRFATWPQPVFDSAWSRPSYRMGAALLAGIFLGLSLTGILIGELSPWATRLYALIGALVALRSWPPLLAEVIWVALKVLVVLHIILLNGLWSIWWERKISAHIQSRVGPTYAGSPKNWNFHGWAQTAIDGIKLLLKEDITPAAADQWVHALAPAIVVVPCVIAFAPVLFGQNLAAANLDMGTLYIFAFAGISVAWLVLVLVRRSGWRWTPKFLVARRSAVP